jgi:hypothetical protein
MARALLLRQSCPEGGGFICKEGAEGSSTRWWRHSQGRAFQSRWRPHRQGKGIAFEVKTSSTRRQPHLQDGVVLKAVSSTRQGHCLKVGASTLRRWHGVQGGGMVYKAASSCKWWECLVPGRGAVYRAVTWCRRRGMVHKVPSSLRWRRHFRVGGAVSSPGPSSLRQGCRA